MQRQAFIVTCRTLADYAACGLPVPTINVVRVECMVCHAPATISPGAAARLEQIKATRDHGLCGSLCTTCMKVLLAIKGKIAGLELSEHGAEVLERSDSAKQLLAQLMEHLE